MKKSNLNLRIALKREHPLRNEAREIELTNAKNELDKMRELAERLASERHQWKSLADEREKMLVEKSKSIDDLKERLAVAEAENERMRGYISRVQEDDIVREELVGTGDPNGEQILVPKRKHDKFSSPDSYNPMAGHTVMGYDDGFGRNRPKPKHWVTY